MRGIRRAARRSARFSSLTTIAAAVLALAASGAADAKSTSSHKARPAHAASGHRSPGRNSAAASHARDHTAADRRAAAKKAEASKHAAAKKAAARRVAGKSLGAAARKKAAAAARRKAAARIARVIRAAGPAPPIKKQYDGVASFYTGRQRTASGARYNPKAMTAAHRSLPFGTKVRVVDKRSGRAIVVTINDRGPYKRGRVIDLSRAAARALGMGHRGVSRVRVTVLRRRA